MYFKSFCNLKIQNLFLKFEKTDRGLFNCVRYMIFPHLYLQELSLDGLASNHHKQAERHGCFCLSVFVPPSGDKGNLWVG